MKSAAALFCATLLLTVSLGMTEAQDDPFGPAQAGPSIQSSAPISRRTSNIISGPRSPGRPVVTYSNFGTHNSANSDEIKLQSQTNKIVGELRKLNSASTDEEKEQADKSRGGLEERLRQTLAKRFDFLVKSREQQIEALQKQIETLQNEIRKRRDAKDEIVELRVKTLLHEANGLGFPDTRYTLPQPAAGAYFRSSNQNGGFFSREVQTLPATVPKAVSPSVREQIQ